MLHRVIMVGMCAVLLIGAADPPWRTLGTCLTPQGTVCRTMRWERTGWDLSWGIHPIQRWSGMAILAYSHNGPFMERYSQKTYQRNWFIPDRQWDVTQVKFPVEQRTIEIDSSSKTYKVRSGVRGGLTVWNTDDSDCAKMASAFSLMDLRRRGESTVAGFRAIVYTGLRSKNERLSVWLAPSLGCTQMVVTDVVYNIFGLPTAYSRLQVTFVQVGEPDRKLFEVPSGFTQIH